MPAAGLCPRPAREKGFPSNLFFHFRLIHLLSLYREVYLTPKQGLFNPNGLRPNRPLTLLTLVAAAAEVYMIGKVSDTRLLCGCCNTQKFAPFEIGLK